MKELSIEEKAARYDKAIEIAKSNYDTIVGMDENCTFARSGIINTFHHMFPELKESENDDEKIRKMLIAFVKNDCIIASDKNKQYALAWLEKQGDIDRRIQEEIEKQTKQQWKAEKQGEPKFHVGDWIICCGYAQTQIIDITTNMYKMSNGDIRPFNMVDNNHSIRLWTIQDAKDGDILANKHGAIFINAGSSNGRGTLDCYCLLSVQNKFCIEEHKTGSWLYKDEIKPATKEQRDLLFQKMHEAGYEWDAEKKELKKIVTPIFKIGDRVRYKEHSCDGVITEITDTDYVCGDAKLPISTQDKLELVEQKSAWSEEEVHDETKQECDSIDVSGSIKTSRIETLKNILSYFRYERKTTLEEINISFIPCLENLLKDAENTNGYADWSEDDEEMKILLQTEYEKGKADAIEAAMESVTKDKESAIKFLKSAGIMNENGELAKEYVVDNIEQNPAWSEDDEEMFDAIIADIQFTQKTHNHEVNQVVYEREIDWLKSIKDRVHPQWKPSEEELNALDIAKDIK